MVDADEAPLWRRLGWMALQGDRGASALGFENAASIALDAEALFDIDTPADLELARAIAARRE